jgi:hypothetical protein
MSSSPNRKRKMTKDALAPKYQFHVQSAVVLPVATSNSAMLGINIAAVVKPNAPHNATNTNKYLPSSIDVIM